MTSKRFIWLTLLFAAVLCGLVAGINWRINFYGVFGDARGQRRTVISNEGETKFLYGLNYLSANFDALLVGSSVSMNIDPVQLRGVRMYNASISAGNITEEKLIVEQSIREGHFKTLLICLTPYLVKDHVKKEGGLDSRDLWEALGSPQLIADYLGAIAISRGWARQRFTPEGMQDIDGVEPPMQPDLALAEFLERNSPEQRRFEIDTLAIRDLMDLIQLAHRRSLRVMVFLPPVYRPKYQALRSEYRTFETYVKGLLGSGEELVDFNDGSHAEITADPATFYDGTHLSNLGANRTAHVLDQFIGR